MKVLILRRWERGELRYRKEVLDLAKEYEEVTKRNKIERYFISVVLLYSFKFSEYLIHWRDFFSRCRDLSTQGLGWLTESLVRSKYFS